MVTICEFCDEPNVGNHLLECKMVIETLLEGNTALCFTKSTNIVVVDKVKWEGKLPILRWKNIKELCEDLCMWGEESESLMRRFKTTN